MGRRAVAEKPRRIKLRLRLAGEDAVWYDLAVVPFFFIMKLLIVEDSPRLLRSLGVGLRKLGHAVDLVGDGAEGLAFARLYEYDAIVLDLMLPKLDGLSVLQRLRSQGRKTPILILSAKDRVEDRVCGLKNGADDYLVKPFAFEELCVRLQALARRLYGEKNPTIALGGEGGLLLQTATRSVSQGGQTLGLTPAEYGLLEHLALNRGRVLSKEQLIDALHDSEACPGPNVIEVLICTLRRKLAEAGGEAIVQTRRGYGYFIA
jgi:DNA-binding response OmpR family regulator